MKTMCIGDIHGRDYWKAFPVNEFDKVIFLGDYVDAYDKKDEQIIKNLQDILQYKRDNMEKCILLIGNHDLQYMFSVQSHGCSGYRPSYYHMLHHIFQTDKNLFLPAYQEGKYLFTHAGVTSIWWKKFLMKSDREVIEHDMEIADHICEAFPTTIELFDVGHYRGGWCKSGGPFWADRSESTAYLLPNYDQIVGHTPVKEIGTHVWGEGKASITFCDSIYDYYELDI
jgi:hypothetical protein